MVGRLFFLCLFGLMLLGSSTAQEWRNYSGVADDFSVQVPFEMTTVGGVGRDDWRIYSGHSGQTWLFVISDRSKAPNRMAPFSAFLLSQGQTFTIGKSPSQPGLISFRDSFGYYQQLGSFEQDGRVYTVQTVSKNEVDFTADKFFASFTLGGTALGIPIQKKTTPPAISPLPLVGAGTGNGVAPSIGRGSETGAGNGPGLASTLANGQGSGTGTAPPEAIQRTSVKVLTKPRPTYTEAARFYQISGNVIARITFLSSGEIGSISIVQGLPFGLTNAAIAAAKAIQFEPATQDGKPVTVTKQVEYTFTIY